MAPLLMVQADFSDGPDSARRHFAAVQGIDERLVGQSPNTHFEYYEDSSVNDHTVGLVTAWFRDHRSTSRRPCC